MNEEVSLRRVIKQGSTVTNLKLTNLWIQLTLHQKKLIMTLQNQGPRQGVPIHSAQSESNLQIIKVSIRNIRIKEEI